MDIKSRANTARLYTTQPLIEPKTSEVPTMVEKVLSKQTATDGEKQPIKEPKEAEVPTLNKALLAFIENDEANDLSMEEFMVQKEFQRFGKGIKTPSELQNTAKLITDSVPFKLGEPSNQLSPPVMKQLEQLKTMELAPGIDRNELIRSIIANLRNPESINQGDRQTCSAAVVQAMLAKEDPAEYVRLMAGLASPKGEFKLKDGSILKRDPNYQLGSGKSITDKLMQPALMQKATKGGYDSQNDRRVDGKGQGLYASEQAQLMESVLGQKTETVFGNDPELFKQIEAALNDGKPVSATIKVRDPRTGEIKGHSVTLEKVGGMITYLDPKKGRVTVSADAFKAMMESVNLPTQYMTASLQARPKQEGLVAGWGFPNPLEAVASAAKAVANGVAQMAHEAQRKVEQTIHEVKQKVEEKVNEVKQNVEKAVTEVKKAVDTTKAAVAGAIDNVKKGTEAFIDGTKKAFNDAANYIKEGLKDPGKVLQDAKNFWDQYGGMIVTAASIACMVIPGLQVVSVGLAIYQGLQGGAEMIEGIRTNDWKRAVGGMTMVLGAVASGGAAGGLKMFGESAKLIADAASTGSKITGSIVVAMEAIEAKDPGKLVGALAKGVGAVAGKLGNGLDKIAEKGLQIYDKCEKYSGKLQQAYDAFSTGDILGGLAVSASAAASANTDLGGNADISEKLEMASKASGTAKAIKNAAEKQDLAGVLTGVGQLGEDLNLPPEAMKNINEGLRIGNKVLAVNDAINSNDPQKIRAATRDLAETTHVIDQNTLNRIDGMANKGIQVGQAIQSGDYAAAAQAGISISVDAGVLSEKDAQGLSDTTRKANNLVRAAQSGDPDAILAASKDLGLIDENTEKTLGKVSKNAEALKSAIDRQDYGAVAAIAGDVAVESGVLSDTDRRNIQDKLDQGKQLVDNLQNGNYAEVAKQLGVPQDVIANVEDKKALYDKAMNGDYAGIAEQLGVPAEQIQLAQRGVNIANAFNNGDFETLSKEAGLSELEAQVMNHPTVMAARDQLKQIEELKTALEQGDLSIAKPLLDQFPKLPELPNSEMLKGLNSQLQQAIDNHQNEAVAALGKQVAGMAGVLADPTVQKVTEFSAKVGEAQEKIKGMNGQEAIQFLQRLFSDREEAMAQLYR